jgi:hypothetical protein
MKTLWVVIATLLLVMVISYASIAFVTLEANPVNWSEETRGLYAVLLFPMAILISVLAGGAYEESNSNN